MADLVGKLVRVRGLTGRADLNGCVGKAISLIEETGRLAVQIGETKEAIKIKPANLDDITEASAAFGRRQATLRKWLEAQQQWVAGKHQVVKTAQLEELRELVAEAEACSALVPEMDGGAVDPMIESIAKKRGTLPGLSCKPPSKMSHIAYTDLRRARLFLAEALEAQRLYEEAQPLYVAMVSATRDAGDAFFEDETALCTALNNCGLCHKRRGCFVEAVACYREALEIFDPDRERTNPLPMDRSMEPTVRTNLQRAKNALATPVAPRQGASYLPQEATPKMSDERGPAAAARLKAEGTEAFKDGRFTEAIRWYTAALEADTDAEPDEAAKLLCNRAACLSELGDHETAACDASRAIQLVPTYAKAHYRLGVAMRGGATPVGGEKSDSGEAAFTEALRLSPGSALIKKKLEEAQEHSALAEKHMDETTTGASPNFGGITMLGWAASPLGILDRLIGTEGEEAVLGGEDGAYLNAIAKSHQAWHDGIKACICCIESGAKVRKDRNIQIGVRGFDVLVPLRLLSTAIWATDRPETTCPMSKMWVDGREIQHQQLRNATEGLISLAQSPRDDLPTAKSDGKTRVGYLANMSRAEIAAEVAELDLTDPIVRERLESTIRMLAVYGFVTNFILVGAQLDPPTLKDALRAVFENLRLADFWRRLTLRRATMQLNHERARDLDLENDPGAAGKPGRDPTEAFDSPYPTGQERREAIAALNKAGGSDLADCIGSAGTSRAMLQVLMARMRDTGLEVFDTMVGLCGREWDDDPKIAEYAGWCAFETAHLKWPGATWAAAHAHYSRAASLSREGHRGYEPSEHVWEAAASLGMAGGDDGNGTPLRRLRAMAAEAAGLYERRTRGILVNVSRGGPGGGPSQAEVAVRTAVEATAERMPESLLSADEYFRLTKEGMLSAAHKSVAKISQGPKSAPSGPMWSAGRPPSYSDAPKEDGSDRGPWSFVGQNVTSSSS